MLTNKLWIYLSKRKCPSCNENGLSIFDCEKINAVKTSDCEACGIKVSFKKGILDSALDYFHAFMIMLATYAVFFLRSEQLLLGVILISVFLILPYLKLRFTPYNTSYTKDAN